MLESSIDLLDMLDDALAGAPARWSLPTTALALSARDRLAARQQRAMRPGRAASHDRGAVAEGRRSADEVAARDDGIGGRRPVAGKAARHGRAEGKPVAHVAVRHGAVECELVAEVAGRRRGDEGKTATVEVAAALIEVVRQHASAFFRGSVAARCAAALTEAAVVSAHAAVLTGVDVESGRTAATCGKLEDRLRLLQTQGLSSFALTVKESTPTTSEGTSSGEGEKGGGIAAEKVGHGVPEVALRMRA